MKLKDILVVAPHPDDESLGCGGAIAKWVARGHRVHWLIVTNMAGSSYYSAERIAERNSEIERLAAIYPFTSTTQLTFAPATLTTQDLPALIAEIGGAIKQKSISTLVLPYRYDAHSDHQIVFEAGAACTKSFRYPSIQQVLVYETLSETDYGVDSENIAFKPNYFVDISQHLETKLAALKIFGSEFAEHPFPRSIKNVKALATLRGAQTGVEAAEAFIQLKYIELDD